MENAQTSTPTQAPRHRSTNPQPLAVTDLNDALLTLKTASATAGLSQSTLYRLASQGRLKMVKLGNRCTRIRVSELKRFMNTLG